ncbi:MAG: hypothetical protein ABIZ51_03820 [Bacteroidia bacterium]
MRNLKILVSVIFFTFIVALIFEETPMLIFFGWKLLGLIGFIIILAFIIVHFFEKKIAVFFAVKKNEISIRKNSPLALSIEFMVAIFSTLSLIDIAHISIPPIIAYIFLISVGMVIGSYWQWIKGSK